ncbi:MAG: hypothetical protein JO151_11395 [Verrucomicrobia bacterium]|nr:hypothetical protein [Verrucomicrobiota bacterium]
MAKAWKLPPSASPSDLFEDIRALIKQARAATARTINSAVTLLNWQVGRRIRRDLLHEERAEYGEQIVATLAQQLTWSHVPCSSHASCLPRNCTRRSIRHRREWFQSYHPKQHKS